MAVLLFVAYLLWLDYSSQKYFALKAVKTSDHESSFGISCTANPNQCSGNMILYQALLHRISFHHSYLPKTAWYASLDARHALGYRHRNVDTDSFL